MFKYAFAVRPSCTYVCTYSGHAASSDMISSRSKERLSLHWCGIVLIGFTPIMFGGFTHEVERPRRDLVASMGLWLSPTEISAIVASCLLGLARLNSGFSGTSLAENFVFCLPRKGS